MKNSVLSLTVLLTLFSVPTMAHESQTTGVTHLLEHGAVYALLICLLLLASVIGFRVLAKARSE